MFGHDQRRSEVARLEREAERLMQARTPAEAVPLQRRALALVRNIVSEQLAPSPDDLRMLGALQYALGTTLLSVDEPAAALSALDEAEDCYCTLRDLGNGRMQQLIADVSLRRARVLHQTGRVTSAILEAGIALELMTPPDDDGPEMLQYDVDRARVLVANAELLSVYGDPDLAATSADAAVRLLLSRSAEINVSAEADFYVDILRNAATLAQVLHAGQGRVEIALAAGSVAADTFVIAPAGRVVSLRGKFGRVPAYRRRQLAMTAMRHGLVLMSAGRQAEGAEQLAFARETDREAADAVEAGWLGIGEGPVSLAAALDVARPAFGPQPVPDLEFIAASSGLGRRPFSPRERCAPQMREAVARSLATVADALPPSSPEARRIRFEAHCLFAWSSTEHLLEDADWDGQNARPWGQLLYALIGASHEQGDAELCADLHTWLKVATARVNPFQDSDSGRG